MQTASPESSAGDFDFLVGRWQVHHRRLKARLAGCTEWQEFGGSSQLVKLLDGHGNVDDNVIELPAGRYRAASLRAFDPQTRLWAIWWLDARYPQSIETPVRGSFSEGVGSFYADEEFEGRPIKVRFLWSDITPVSCRWQQAFSPDDGASWETNWVMDFKRTA